MPKLLDRYQDTSGTIYTVVACFPTSCWYTLKDEWGKISRWSLEDLENSELKLLPWQEPEEWRKVT